MKVILLENVRKVGSIGEIIDVKRGFARNFLIAKKKALFASKENVKEVEKLKTDSKIDGVFFASAALSRLKICQENEETLNNFLPAPCQGFIVATCLKDNKLVIETLNKINNKNNSIATRTHVFSCNH